MTSDWYKFKFSRNFALLCILGRQQRLNDWRQNRIVSDRIVAHWKSTFQRCIDYVDIAGRCSARSLQLKYALKITIFNLRTRKYLESGEQMFVVDGVTVKNAREGWFSELCAIYQVCRALAFA